ncbi:phospholipid-binding protein MlaC [Sutterella sp.]|uniref:MlaC/ttg2D family ABC transporter substrate-binding protein n=1 Tax=Sutterella sp. TaxID=1981025 RepID=UPI0026DEBA68|nr:ABC transporter substrate-binding protein [Sutterella sp.]MDO5531279.1 ABC transporter substrate-binding protein [Sutterella sp.]
MQRRTLLAGLSAIPALAAFPGIALAADLPYDDKGDPFAFVVDLSNAVLERIRASDSLRSGDIESLRKLVDDVIMPATDFTMMTRMTVGPKWRQATKEQRQQLQDGFELLLMRVYAGGLSAVKDQKCELRPTRVKDVKPEMVIRTLLTSGSEQPISLDYRIYKAKTGTWKIVDVNIEGIWMVENYRSQFSSVLSQDGIDGLIRLFNEKGEQLAESMKQDGAKK